MNEKGQIGLGFIILLAILIVVVLVALTQLNNFIGGSSIFQYIGTPVIFGIVAIMVGGIVAYFVNEQLHFFQG